MVEKKEREPGQEKKRTSDKIERALRLLTLIVQPDSKELAQKVLDNYLKSKTPK